MQTIRRLLLKVSSAFIKGHRSGVRFLLFHEIKDYQRDTFECLINFLHKNYGFISPDACIPFYRTNGIRFVISFDDGFSSQSEAAREILDPLNIKALFFVCPRYVGLQGKKAAEFAIVNMKRVDVTHMTSDLYPVSWDDLLSLSSKGHVVGSHGLNHMRLTETSNEVDLEREILLSGEELEEMLHRKINWFAYPYGSIASIDRRSLMIIGRRYRYCCSGLRGINTQETNELCITRESIDLDRPIDQLKRIAVGGLDFLYYFKRRKLSRMRGINDHGNADSGR